jgi:hypothetical protein
MCHVVVGSDPGLLWAGARSRMTGPRPAVGRVGKIAGRAVRGGRRAMAALRG